MTSRTRWSGNPWSETPGLQSTRATRIVCAGVLLAITGGDRHAAIGRAEDPALEAAAPADSGAPEARPPAAPPTTDTERAARVRAFVVSHQPELAELLGRLEKRKPAEFAAAITDLDESVQALAASRAKDDRLYELELRSWQARTRIDLLVARWMTGSKKARARLEADIRGAIAAEIDARVDALAYRKQWSAAWYDRQIMRLRDDRDELVAERLEALLAEPGRKRKPGGGDRDKAAAERQDRTPTRPPEN